MVSPTIVGFVGVDYLSLKFASSLTKSGFQLQFFEEAESAPVNGFLDLGAAKCSSPMDAAKDASTVIVVGGLNHTLFGEHGVVKGLHKNSVVILQSALPLNDVVKIEKQLADEEGTIFLVDAHVFQGYSEASKEKITVIASGSQEAMQKAHSVLSALSEMVSIFEGEVGTGSKIRMVNDLLEGIHMVACVEAMFLGVRAGIHPTILYDIISNAAGSSR